MAPGVLDNPQAGEHLDNATRHKTLPERKEIIDAAAAAQYEARPVGETSAEATKRHAASEDPAVSASAVEPEVDTVRPIDDAAIAPARLAAAAHEEAEAAAASAAASEAEASEVRAVRADSPPAGGAEPEAKTAACPKAENAGGILPTRLGIQCKPPKLVIEYFRNGEAPEDPPRRTLHSVPISSCMSKLRTKDLVLALRSHPEHGPYVKRVQPQQLCDLLRRLRALAKAGEAAGRLPKPRDSSRPCSTPPGPAQAKGQLPPPAGTQCPAAAEPAAASETRPVDPVWPAGLWARWSCDWAREGMKLKRPDMAELFEAFRTSRGVISIAESFAQLLCASAEADPAAWDEDAAAAPIDRIAAAVGRQKHTARALWERLEARRGAAQYKRLPLAGRRAVIVGAGPVGLRCALELRLLGAEVAVLERRQGFDRINRLHLWPWCGEDLKGWGAKVLEPPEPSFGADPDFLHIGISELQMLLLKPCLLLGVQVLFGAEFQGAQPGAAAWTVSVGDAGRLELPCPRPPAVLPGVSLLVGADGPRSTVARSLAFDVQETTGHSALGLVANFVNQQTFAEKTRRPFSLARQFYKELFAQCEQETQGGVRAAVRGTSYLGPTLVRVRVRSVRRAKCPESNKSGNLLLPGLIYPVTVEIGIGTRLSEPPGMPDS